VGTIDREVSCNRDATTVTASKKSWWFCIEYRTGKDSVLFNLLQMYSVRVPLDTVRKPARRP
jgi:hypothetical protein